MMRESSGNLATMDLITRSRAGDQQAFALLFDAYKNLVYKTAFLILRSTDEAEDALQDVFLQVFRSLSSFEPTRGAISTWLYRITVNHCLNRRRRRDPASSTLESIPDGYLKDGAARLDDRLGEEDAIRQALDRLSDKLRAVVVLRYYGDLSHAEISQTLSIPLGTVKSRLDLAIRTMRVSLEKAPEEGASYALRRTESPK